MTLRLLAIVALLGATVSACGPAYVTGKAVKGTGKAVVGSGRTMGRVIF